MQSSDIIVIGAGASGLMAANLLAEAGLKVCLLEATERAGGRIHSQIFSPGIICETGAEFVHGSAPVTNDLLKKANLKTVPAEGSMLTVRNGVWFNEDHQSKEFEKLKRIMQEEKDDQTLQEFLDRNLKETEFEEVRKSVKLFAEGFSLADIENVSLLSILQEWASEEEKQYRVVGGYSGLIKYLLDTCLSKGVSIHFNSDVHKIKHRTGHVEVHTNEEIFPAGKLIITVPAGMMRSGSIQFEPAIEKYIQSFHDLGFGSVIKILMQFQEPFWLNHAEDIGFILSDETIPTWWTQFPSKSTVLTGWLGGPGATKLAAAPESEILRTAYSSLSNIFHMEVPKLRKMVKAQNIFCWDQNPYVKGGYTYHTLRTQNAKAILNQPIGNTVYFGGEALYAGESQGTVEAAVANGKLVAEKVLVKI